MLIPNNKLDTMELLYPKRKPVGKIKVDKNHPLAKHMFLAFVPQSLGVYSNLVDDSVPTVRYPDKLAYNSTYLTFNNATTGGLIAGSLTFGSHAGDVAVVARIRLGAVMSNYDRLIDSKTAYNGTDGFYVGVGGTNFEVNTKASNYRSIAHGMNSIDFYDVLFVFNDIHISIYVDGKELLGSPITVQPITNGKRLVTIGHNSGYNDHGFIGDVEYLYATSELNVDKLLDLSNNPYQILMPA